MVRWRDPPALADRGARGADATGRAALAGQLEQDGEVVGAAEDNAVSIGVTPEDAGAASASGPA